MGFGWELGVRVQTRWLFCYPDWEEWVQRQWKRKEGIDSSQRAWGESEGLAGITVSREGDVDLWISAGGRVGTKEVRPEPER